MKLRERRILELLASGPEMFGSDIAFIVGGRCSIFVTLARMEDRGWLLAYDDFRTGRRRYRITAFGAAQLLPHAEVRS